MDILKRSLPVGAIAGIVSVIVNGIRALRRKEEDKSGGISGQILFFSSGPDLRHCVLCRGNLV